MRKSNRRLLPLVLAIGTVTPLAAGCGGGTSSPNAGAAAGPPTTIVSAAYGFSRCMREHGVASFPDPIVHSSAGHQEVGIHITPSQSGSPQFASAQKACHGIMPGPGNSNGGRSPQQIAARVKGLISFADCMRSHHVPTFPDPTTQGQVTPAMVVAAGINLHAPAVQAGAMACVPSSQGQLTSAQVAQALHGGG